jgi:hypothetical protein
MGETGSPVEPAGIAPVIAGAMVLNPGGAH